MPLKQTWLAVSLSRSTVMLLSRGMLRSPVTTLSAITVSALWAWPHSPKTIRLTPSFLAAWRCIMAVRANWTSSYQTP